MSEVPLTAVQRALRWLRAVLSAGPLPVVEVEKLARDVGVTRRTLRRARKKLGVVSYPLGFGGPHVLALPEHADGESPDPAHMGPAPGQDAGTVTAAPTVASTEELHGGDPRRQPRDAAARHVVLRRVQ